jgi:hypothetical protein
LLREAEAPKDFNRPIHYPNAVTELDDEELDRMIEMLRERALAARQEQALVRQLPWLDHMLPAVLLFQCIDGYRYQLGNGTHRFYASIVAGFSHVPTFPGWIPDTEVLAAR